MYLALAALGGLGLPEMIVVLLLYGAMLAVPIWAFWKFYQVFSRIANELAEIKQVLRDGKPV
jgi:hypothetical protein